MTWKYLDRITLAVVGFYAIWLNWRLDDLETKVEKHERLLDLPKG